MLQDLSQNPFERTKISQVSSKLSIRMIHMDFFLQTYMSGSIPSWSRKKPIGVFFFKPKVSATLLTLLLVLRQRKEAWTNTSRTGKVTPERAKRMQLNWKTRKQRAAMRIIPSVADFPLACACAK